VKTFNLTIEGFFCA